MSIIDATDETREMDGGDDNSKCIHPSCDTEIEKVVLLFFRQAHRVGRTTTAAASRRGA